MIYGLGLLIGLMAFEVAGFELPLAISLVMALLLVFAKDFEREVEFALVAGLVIDIIGMRSVGLSSLVLVGISTVLAVYKWQMSQRSAWTLVGLGAIGLMVYMVLMSEFEVGRWLVAVGLMIGWFRFLGRGARGDGGIKLGERMVTFR